MPRLFYCNTVYLSDPPSDINPLILQKYFNGQLLILCARDAMVVRINNMISDPLYPYDDQVVTAYGWWEADTMGLLDSKTKKVSRSELRSYDAVVIMGKDRIDPIFHSLVKRVEFVCNSLNVEPKEFDDDDDDYLE